MRISESAEDYLEQVLIQSERHGAARSIDIANALNVSKASVSIAMKKLCRENYVVFDEDHLICLTESGRAIAERIYNRHVRLTGFLISLGVPREIAEEDACRIEHDISEASFQALCQTCQAAG